MAERLQRGTLARICSVMDQREVVVERSGLSRRLPASFSVIALDEGREEDEMVGADLLDRLAFHVDLDGLEKQGHLTSSPTRTCSFSDLELARSKLPEVAIPDTVFDTLSGVSLALGIGSMRGAIFAARASRAAAALEQRTVVEEQDMQLAIRLVLAPRATRWPETESEAEAPPESPDTQEPEEKESSRNSDSMPEDMVVEAVKASMPADMLARLQAEALRARAKGARGRGGPKTASRLRGRPLGVRQAVPRSGQRLNIAATLKAAAPWQRLRNADSAETLPGNDVRSARFRVRPEDFHVTRYKARQETTTIFLVDASGSAAAQRLAEAKGAIELLLAQCYVRRDQVALIAFRGDGAETLLPPTRALARARRELAALPGGGGTPLATGIDAAGALARDLQKRGQNPVVVMMTDGRANIARDGSPGHERANREAMESSRVFQSNGWSSVLVDTARRPRPKARSIAEAMGAQYFPMPYAEANALSSLIQDTVAG